MLIYVNTYYCLLGMCPDGSWCPVGDKRKRGSLCPSLPLCFYQIVQVTPLIGKLLKP